MSKEQITLKKELNRVPVIEECGSTVSHLTEPPNRTLPPRCIRKQEAGSFPKLGAGNFTVLDAETRGESRGETLSKTHSKTSDETLGVDGDSAVFGAGRFSALVSG